MILPEVTQDALLWIDATPNEDYPLRILRAYRQNCDCRWVSDEPSKLVNLMNEDAQKRANLLDRAIAILEATLLPNIELRYGNCK